MSGAELVKKLAETGTGAAKLDVARGVLRAKGRNATATDVLAALDADPSVPELTRRKAELLAAGGRYEPEKVAAVNIEDELLSDEEKALLKAKDEAEKAEAKKAEKAAAEKAAKDKDAKK